jgi:hypothetical protein
MGAADEAVLNKVHEKKKIKKIPFKKIKLKARQKDVRYRFKAAGRQ